jgi:hypothetical protein
MGYQVSLVANTNSMEPFIDDNCVVALEKLNSEWREGRLKRQPLVPGDVVVWQIGKMRIIHELIRSRKFNGKMSWLIQGVNNKAPDLAGRYIDEKYIVARHICTIYTKQKRSGD